MGNAGVLSYRCGPLFAALTGGTLAAYTAFTFSFTQVLQMADVFFALCLAKISFGSDMMNK